MKRAPASIRFLVIGHLCKDIIPEGYRPGGVVTYAGLTAHRLGVPTGILTRGGPDISPGALLQGIHLRMLSAERTTTFHNQYTAGTRVQRLLAVSEPITAEDVPTEWQDVPVVLLGPVAQEIAPELARLFPDALCGAVLQGWMREWDDSGRVSNRPALLRRLSFEGIQVVTLSEEELGGDDETLDYLRRRVPVVVLTRGRRGAVVFAESHVYHVPPRPAQEVDPTGAGDVFAAAFLVRLYEGCNYSEAAYFANVTASFSIEQPGPAGIPERRQVLEWIHSHPLGGVVPDVEQSTSTCRP
ncbi:MAG: PfkB family carbohydrate kinase [Anaerolineae bacterium]